METGGFLDLILSRYTNLRNDRHSRGGLGVLPLPLGDGWGEGLGSIEKTGTPHEFAGHLADNP